MLQCHKREKRKKCPKKAGPKFSHNRPAGLMSESEIWGGKGTALAFLNFSPILTNMSFLSPQTRLTWLRSAVGLRAKLRRSYTLWHHLCISVSGVWK